MSQMTAGPTQDPTKNGSVHVVVGAGPLGLAVARELRRRQEPARIVLRGGRAGASGDPEVVSADVSDPDQSRRAFEGARVVYQCAAPRYSKWPALLPALMDGVIQGASAVGARIVYGDNLYSYGRVQGPLTEDLPYRPVGVNGRTRAQVAEALMAAHADGKVRAAIGRSSDFFGPFALNSTVGERVFARMLAAKPAQVLGNPDVPHTVTFIDDFARALVTLGSRDEALGEVWHVPSAATVTIRRFVEMIAEESGRPAKLRVTPSWLLAIGGMFNPDVRALREVLYQSHEAWVMDHSKFERAFGPGTTPHPEAIRTTLEWFSHADGSKTLPRA
jgi:nucleoside-diphosphate-sugar epimerase